jgi:hypothetical protein
MELEHVLWAMLTQMVVQVRLMLQFNIRISSTVYNIMVIPVWALGIETNTSCPMGNTYPDGCPGAPTGAQFPTMFTGYLGYSLSSHRPPWNVPGVDSSDRASIDVDYLQLSASGATGTFSTNTNPISNIVYTASFAIAPATIMPLPWFKM